MTTNTVDLTKTVNAMRETFIVAATTYIINAALSLPGLGLIGAWFVRVLFGAAIKWALERLSESLIMKAFFLNTAVQKQNEADEYLKKYYYKKLLPPEVPRAEYKKAELEEINAFINFVSLS